MKLYKVTLISDDKPIDVICEYHCDNVIQALDRFTELCDVGQTDYNLSDYSVWMYAQKRERHIMHYSYSRDEYGAYEELTPCQY